MTKLQFRGLKLLHELQETSVLHIQVNFSVCKAPVDHDPAT